MTEDKELKEGDKELKEDNNDRKDGNSGSAVKRLTKIQQMIKDIQYKGVYWDGNIARIVNINRAYSYYSGWRKPEKKT